MALSPSAPTSPLPRQLLRYVSSERLLAASRAAPSPKRRPVAPRPGSGGHVHAAPPVMATTAPRVVMREPAPPGLPVQGSGGKTHAAPAAVSATTTVTTGVVMGVPAPSGLPTQGSGGKVAAALAAVSLAVRRPKPPGTPIEGSGGNGGAHH